MNFADETWVHCPVTKNKNKPECTFSSLSGKMEASRIAFWTQYFHIARSKHNRVQEHLFRYSGYVRGLIIWLQYANIEIQMCLGTISASKSENGSECGIGIDCPVNMNLIFFYNAHNYE